MESRVSDIWVMVRLEDVKSSTILDGNNKNSFLLDPWDTAQIRSVLQHVYIDQPTLPFALTINNSQSVAFKGNELEWIDVFCSLLYHPDYFRVKGGNLITFLGEIEGGIKELSLKDKLSQGLKAQGFESVKMVDINSTDTMIDQHNGIMYSSADLVRSSSAFSDIYISALMMSEVPIALFVPNDTELINTLAEFKVSAEKKLFQEEPHLFQLLTLFYKKSSAMQKLEKKNELLNEDIRSKSDYLNYLLTKSGDVNDLDSMAYSDIARLKNYYTNEYEILPLWYKRFGHIVKVLYGKRTFRSLFNDRIKKYKD